MQTSESIKKFPMVASGAEVQKIQLRRKYFLFMNTHVRFLLSGLKYPFEPNLGANWPLFKNFDNTPRLLSLPHVPASRYAAEGHGGHSLRC